MIEEAVILAGGFGTRLSHVVANVPKPAAPVAGRPFLFWLLMRLADAGLKHVVLATGYKHEVIAARFGDSFRGMKLSYSQEQTPLFTGGAVRQAAMMLKSDDFLVLNGDTLFDIDLHLFCDFHLSCHANLTVALRQVSDGSRYGVVECRQNKVVSFCEKMGDSVPALINGGVYAVNRQWLLTLALPQKFSFENDLMQPLAGQEGFCALRAEGYFIDIGVPDDYYRAQKEFLSLFPSDEFLFLDRDGVLNRHLPGDYVRNTDLWQWIHGVLDTMPLLAKRYKRIFVVSNQQGVGKGLMSNADLESVHALMLADIQAAGGRVDAVYVCADLATSGSADRKPAIGMALRAKRDFPEVDFSRAVMVGDSLTDMQFAANAGMRAVFLTNNNPIPEQVRDYTDIIIPDLQTFGSL
ncbi:MAG: HAD-IIIA family hydrolase [Paludibacteraceae bacterium]|nr:HAD-IIIA family hydrolase [Paludibacteraceae bacterium]